MNLSDKAKKLLKKSGHLSVVDPIKESEKHNQNVSRETKESKSSQHITKQEESMLTDQQLLQEIKNINIHDIDINFSELGSENDTGSRVLVINPLNPFSNHVELDLEKLNAEGYITPKHANSLLSNTFRMIKRPIINNSIGKGASIVNNANIVMVSSSLPGEGKTFSAINLAISIALEKDKHVLLIDADVNKPTHHEIFGLDENRGLTDILLGKVDDMSDVLHKTNIQSLSLMSAGHEYAHATELLASADMERFVEDVSKRYPDRIVIFDSPPLLLTTESSVLASHMGQVILVIEAEKTLAHQVKKSLSLMSNEIVLLMLNKMREKNEIGSYGYYGYGYGHKSSE